MKISIQNPSAWLPVDVRAVRPLKTNLPCSPEKAVWECVEKDGQAFVLKITTKARLKFLLNERLALIQLSEHFVDTVRIPRLLWFRTRDSFVMLATELVQPQQFESHLLPNAIAATLKHLAILPKSITLTLKGVDHDSQEFPFSLCTREARVLAAEYLNRSALEENPGAIGMQHGDLSDDHFIYGTTQKSLSASWYLIDWEHAHYGSLVYDGANVLVTKALKHSLNNKKRILPWHCDWVETIRSTLRGLGITDASLRMALWRIVISKIDYLVKYGHDRFLHGRHELAYLRSLLPEINTGWKKGSV